RQGQAAGLPGTRAGWAALGLPGPATGTTAAALGAPHSPQFPTRHRRVGDPVQLAKEAFAALIDDWAGILLSDGYGVDQNWIQARQTCVAHLIRTARSVAERQHPDLAAY